MPFPIAATVALFCVATTFSIAAIFWCNQSASTLRRCWLGVVAFVALNFALKIPFGQSLYHGMEYEDCFVHQAVAREFFYGQFGVQNSGSFIESIWSIGSLQGEAGHYQTFFNPIGYSTLIFLGHLLAGDTPQVGHWISIAASCAGVVLVFLMAAASCPGLAFPTAAAVIYSSLPVVNINATSTSSEVLSSLYVIDALLLTRLAYLGDSSDKAKALARIALAFVVSFAIACRRENSLLVVLIPLLIWVERRQVVVNRQELRDIAFIMLLPISYLLFCLGIFANLHQEATAIDSNPFALKHWIRLGPALLAALGNPSSYLCFGIVLLLTPLAWVAIPGSRSVLLTLAVYFGIYISHFRSYYFLQSHEVSAFDMVRYLMNLSPLIAIASAATIWSIPWRSTSRRLSGSTKQKLLLFAGASVIVLGTTLTLHYRSQFVSEEQEVRIRPVISVIEHLQSAPQTQWVFTSLPCLMQIYAPPSLGIIDIDVAAESKAQLVESIIANGNGYVFISENDLRPENLKRYPNRAKWLESVRGPLEKEIQGGSLLRLQHK